MNEAKKARVLEAAQGVFFRYGFKRVTMGDIAQAAGISRPALYLLFCNQEEVFEATLRAFSARALGALRGGLPAQATAKEKLSFAFEVWAIQPFLLLLASPDAKELVDCRFTFAKGDKITLRGEADDAKSIYAFQQGLKGAVRFKQVQLHGITPPSGKQAHTAFSVTVMLGEEQP